MSQVTNGKAYEFAVAEALASASGCQIVTNPQSEYGRRCFSDLTSNAASQYRTTASNAARIISELESLEPNGCGSISFQPDSAGQGGDVRDLVIRTGRDIGISCKTNHADLKHSRLSSRLDFVKDWGIDSNGCSQRYFDEVGKIFNELREIKQRSEGRAVWSTLENVPNRFYWPILEAWSRELQEALRPTTSQNNRCASFVKYLFGNLDFYKVIGRHRARSLLVDVQAFNFNGTLATPKTRLPSRIVGVDKLNGGKYSLTVRMDHGYTFNFRIHNASSRVEPSLKFAISAVGLPAQTILQQMWRST